MTTIICNQQTNCLQSKALNKIPEFNVQVKSSGNPRHGLITFNKNYFMLQQLTDVYYKHFCKSFNPNLRSYFRFRLNCETPHCFYYRLSAWLCILFVHLKYFTTTTSAARTITTTTVANYVKNYYPIKQRHSIVNNNKTLCWLTLTLILLSGIWNGNIFVRAFDIGKFSSSSWTILK